MEDICSLWNYAENADDLKQKLLYTTLELDAARIELKEEARKNEASVNHLLGLLKLAYQERDEAKSNLQKLFCTLSPQQLELETPFLNPKQANNSGITESNNSCFSNNSSPVDSVFDVASSSPPQALPVVATFNSQQHPIVVPIVVDRASMVIDNLVRGKALPEKGRLQEAVKQAGDFFHRHLIGIGDLPKWRNPPPVLPHFVIAPFSTGGCSQLAPMKQHGTRCLNSASSSPYDHEMVMSASYGPSSQFSFGTGASGLYANDRRVSSGLGKRQRMQ